MILQGNQRGGASELAMHLLKDENDHVEVHELRGFVSDDLKSALQEAQAVSRGTRAKQFLYSLSLNPPANENVSTADFEAAVNRVEKKLGLKGQPRAIVFHEKLGSDGQPRRHCHAVWSRIDAKKMKAIPLPHTKYKLRELSKDLYLEHGWDTPRGFLEPSERYTKNFTLAQWQQAKRQGKDPRSIKAALQDSWAISDTQGAFQKALQERDFTLARGDRRGFVVLDKACEVYSVPKWTGIKTKDVRTKLTDQDALPSVDDARLRIAADMTSRLEELRQKNAGKIDQRLRQIDGKKADWKAKHTQERQDLKDTQQQRWFEEVKQRQMRYNKGIHGLFDRMTGRHRRVKEQNEREALLALQRDQKERDAMVFRQMEQTRLLQSRMQRLENLRENRQQTLSRDIEQYQEISQRQREVFELRERVNRHAENKGPKHEM